MGYRIVWTQAAIEDLRSIRDHIADSSEDYAASTIDRIITTVDPLTDFPLMGPRIREYPRYGLRQVLAKPYRVIYRIKGTSLFIVGVIHGARELSKALRGRL